MKSTRNFQLTRKLLRNKFLDVMASEIKVILLHKYVMELNVSHFLSSETYFEYSTSLSDWQVEGQA
jgi:hypothetical protein